MSATLDMSCVTCDIILDAGGTYVTTWTIPGSGNLTGTFTLLVEANGGADAATITGVITDAPLRKVTFTFTAAVTAGLVTNQKLRYAVRQVVGGETYVIAKGALLAKDTPT